MLVPKDKFQHAAVGVLVALFALVIWLLLVHLGVAPLQGLPAAMPLATLVAGLAKEGADWFDNRIRPGSHAVSAPDALFTFAPGLVGGLLVHQVLFAVGS